MNIIIIIISFISKNGPYYKIEIIELPQPFLEI